LSHRFSVNDLTKVLFEVTWRGLEKNAAGVGPAFVNYWGDNVLMFKNKSVFVLIGALLLP
jgi:hypothetical protein